MVSMSTLIKAVSLALIGLTLGAAALGEETSSSDQLEEIVVTGTRAALAESRDKKREAPIVQDSIVAEDLGRFPTTTLPTRCLTSPASRCNERAAAKGSTSTCAAWGPSSASSP